MAFDYKKEYKEFYMPPKKPGIVEVPEMRFLAVGGKGNPNEPEGEYQAAMSLLYGVAFTIKMSKMGDHRIDGYFDYVVPPLEGFWEQDGGGAIDYDNKAAFRWTSVLRLPDFVTRADLAWAVETASQKKKLDCTAAEFLTVDEGLCVQLLHLGPFNEEPASVARMDRYLAEHGYENDWESDRLHHEIYLSDARRVPPENWRTVIRHPIRPAGAD